MPNTPDLNPLMGALVKAIALEVAAELRPVIEAAIAQAVKTDRPTHAGKAPSMLSVRQLAEHIGVAYGTVQHWRKNGRIPIKAHNPPGMRTVRYSRAEVDAWWSAQREN